jgi:hypothetical protein
MFWSTETTWISVLVGAAQLQTFLLGRLRHDGGSQREYPSIASPSPAQTGHADQSTLGSGGQVRSSERCGHADGRMCAAGGILTAGFEQTTIRDSVVSGNRVSAATTSGSATAEGAGIADIGVLTLRNFRISHNSATASGSAGALRGGGMFVGSDREGPPSPRLVLVHSAVTGNVLTAGPATSTQGGGLFALFPVMLRNSVIVRNVPDECDGC